MPDLNEHGQPVGDIVPAWEPRAGAERVALTGAIRTVGSVLRTIAVTRSPPWFTSATIRSAPYS